MRSPSTSRVQAYWPPLRRAGFRAKMDFANQSVELLFSPQAFAATRLASGATTRPVVSPVLPSLFFNYDVNYAATNLHIAPDVKDLGMVTRAWVFNRFGCVDQHDCRPEI